MISRVSWCTPSSHCHWKARTVRNATARDTPVDRDGPVYIEKQLVVSMHQCRSSLRVGGCQLADFGRVMGPQGRPAALHGALSGLVDRADCVAQP